MDTKKQGSASGCEHCPDGISVLVWGTVSKLIKQSTGIMEMHQKIHVPVSLTKQLNTNSSNQILNILSSQQFCSLSALTFQYGEMSIKNGHI